MAYEMNNMSKKEQAYQAIKQAIIVGQLESAKIYSITELSETFGLGRTPAREALVILASEGLIDPIPRSGYQVTSLSIQDMLEIFHLRNVLEVEAAGLAAERITDDVILILEENNREERELALKPHADAAAQAYRKGYDLNLEFHMTIARASGNKRLANLVEKLLNELERVLAYDPYLAEPQQHAEIIEGLKQRDKQEAQKAMKRHLEDTKNRSLSRF
jgi:DNA-binding GntR family transcriptional regulator